jgi:mRNA interferase RelE/StbE
VAIWRVDVSPTARRAIDGLDGQLRRRVLAALFRLESDPRPPGAVKLVGEERTWRVRVGDWRVLYEIHDGVLVVLVVAVAHRREAYR